MDNRTGKRASDECLKYFLYKYRKDLMKLDNGRRKQLIVELRRLQ